jgi:hypothetical protein
MDAVTAGTRWNVAEALFAVAAFAVLCVLVLRTPTFMPEPDDHAYQGSVVALADGYPLTLSTAQMNTLAAHLPAPVPPGAGGGPVPFGARPAGIVQWVRLADGRWISEKDPGYPFLAVVFQLLGIIRWAPLFYAALACLGLYAGARRWLGRFGGAVAAGLYCSSGAALLFAWRDYMPTFIDASLAAAGTGALLWTLLATEATPRRRRWAGLAGFVALELAVFARYTDIVVLGCAVLAVLVVWRRRAAGITGGMLAWWLGSVALFGVGLATFDSLVYGGPLRQGYRPGEITFSLSAIWPNLRYMPAKLVGAMPVLVLGLAALVWMLWRWLRARRAPGTVAATADTTGAGTAGGSGTAAVAPSRARRDAAVGLALGVSWLAVWGLYAAYTWTAQPGPLVLPVIRFYVPALGAIALLGAWLVTRVPGRAWLTGLACVAVTAVAFGLGARSFHEMTSGPSGILRLHGCVAPRPGHGPVRCGPGGPARHAGPPHPVKAPA